MLLIIIKADVILTIAAAFVTLSFFSDDMDVGRVNRKMVRAGTRLKILAINTNAERTAITDTGPLAPIILIRKTEKKARTTG